MNFCPCVTIWKQKNTIDNRDNTKVPRKDMSSTQSPKDNVTTAHKIEVEDHP